MAKLAMFKGLMQHEWSLYEKPHYFIGYPTKFPEYFSLTFHIFSVTSNTNYITTNVVEKLHNRHILV